MLHPCMVAPVLPNETLTNINIQARAKTSALANFGDMLGWWLEHYIFYVKLTDLSNSQAWLDMLVTGDNSGISKFSVDSPSTYANVGSTGLCFSALEAVVENYFIDEDQSITYYGSSEDPYYGPLVHVGKDTGFESAKLGSVIPVEGEDQYLPGQNPSYDPDEWNTDFTEKYTQWERMRAMKLTDATFEDWVAQFGATADTEPPRTEKRPELIRYSRAWKYPSTVVAGDGTATSAVVWDINERADKRRYFNEPGVILGCTVARPKVYFSAQAGGIAGFMDEPYDWLPAGLHSQAYTSVKKFTALEGPVPTTAEDYWIDVRDLLLYGDQFTNYARTQAGFVALPDANMQTDYATEADMQALFASAANSPDWEIRQDGVANLNILGMQTDQT